MERENKIDFFLVGAARCGTTSLYNYLNSNNGIFLPKVKEPNYFSDVDSPKSEDFDLPKPNESYHSKIITSEKIYNSLYDKAINTQLRGDTSPSYLWDRNTAKKIYKHNPEAKIIISLRHPIDRAYSHYIMNYFTGVEINKCFQEALKAPKNSIWGSCNQYLEMSAYFEQVKAYYNVFPKEQIRVLVYEDWTKNLESEIIGLFNFLNVKIDHEVLDNRTEHNKIKPIKNINVLNFLRQNKIKKTIKKIIDQDFIDKLKSNLFEDKSEIQKLDLKIRHQLSLELKEDVEQLSELTGIDFVSKWY